MHRINRMIGIGVFWNLIGLFMSRGASLLFTLFLARLLAPDAFGIVAMMMVFFEMAGVLVESGMGQALIRSKEVTPRDLDTVFYTNLGLGLLAYSMLYLGAPYVADFYNQPEHSILLRITGLVILFNSLKVVQAAVLSREMNFRHQTLANTLGALGAGMIAIVAAYMGAGVWSLVIQILSSAVISAFILWFASDWRPTLHFSYESFRHLFGFGSNLLAEGILAVLFQNSYVMVIGRSFSAEVTGLYYFSRKINQFVSEQVAGAVQQATFPALATLQDDNDSLREKYRKIIQLLMFFIAPVILFLDVIAEPLFKLLFNDKWAGAVVYLQMFSVVGLLFPLHSMNINILNVKGRSDLVFKVGVVKKIVGLVILITSIPFGVTGIIAGQIFASILALIPNAYYSEKLIKYGLKEQLFDAFRPLMIALFASLPTWWFSSFFSSHLLVNVLLGLFCGVLVYLVGCWVTKVEAFTLILRKYIGMQRHQNMVLNEKS